MAERFVRATDEEDTAKNVQVGVDRPYGCFGSWNTTNSEAEVIEADQATVITPNPLSKEGPFLLVLKDAGKGPGTVVFNSRRADSARAIQCR
ncbi:hypothetical protein [Nocardiopsis rhodophaea]|uniref:hypothetical protein n=1 Tax=Nocardiopsis rhodophaea TaxID=280238 RepID=UPI0031D43DAD